MSNIKQSKTTTQVVQEATRFMVLKTRAAVVEESMEEVLAESRNEVIQWVEDNEEMIFNLLSQAIDKETTMEYLLMGKLHKVLERLKEKYRSTLNPQDIITVDKMFEDDDTKPDPELERKFKEKPWRKWSPWA